MLLVVGIGVPVMILINFWSVIRSEWPFWLACYALALPASVVAMWGSQRLADVWSSLTGRQRVLLRCLAVCALWALLVLLPDNRSDRFLDATAITAAALLFWGAYAVFSRVADKIWFSIRRR